MLRKVRQHNPGNRITIVLDNAACQRASIVQKCALELGIKLLFLPSYSPNLNLIERYWKYLKQSVLRNRYYANFDSFRDAITEFVQTSHRTQKKALASLMTLNFQLFNNEDIMAC